ncbi:MAG: glycoside hydrolase family 5 protein [Myxococcota bacterium]
MFAAHRYRSEFTGLLAAFACVACGDAASVATTKTPEEMMDPEEVDSCPADPAWSEGLPDYPRGLHVVGEHIEDAAGNTIVMHGVNRSGTEYRCVQGYGFFDGPDSEESVQAIASWPVNAVRVPLNEACWLGIQGVKAEFAGCNYKNAIRRYVGLLHKYNLIPILELHWSAPNDYRAVRLQPLPDADNSPTFWADVAKTFKKDDGVVFEPFNEPFPGQNNDSNWSWRCWRDGCEEDLVMGPGEAPRTYQGAGMQSLVNAIRGAGAKHLILLGGVKYSNALTQWIAYKPTDPLENLAAAWHVYNYNQCIDATCWDKAPADVAAQFPLVTTEIGQDNCAGEFVTPLMQWLDEHGDGYLAWTWNAYGPCRPAGSSSRGSPYSLITSYTSPMPNGGYAQAFLDHLQSIATPQP